MYMQLGHVLDKRYKENNNNKTIALLKSVEQKQSVGGKTRVLGLGLHSALPAAKPP